MIGEFELIDRFLKRSVPAGSVVALGVGDDCALLSNPAGEQWAVSTDTLIQGVHFFPDVDPAALGHKALAVSLSDLAACGATPRCYFLALALPLPRVDEHWLESFSRGLHALADAHACVLAGGDTTRSPDGVVITITAIGSMPAGSALLRSGAQVGDDLWVSGELGDAALALAFRRGEIELPPEEADLVVPRLERPTPRVRLGERLRGLAHSAIDVSDGLIGDLRHIVQASGVGAIVEWANVPLSHALRRQSAQMQKRCALAGGDDYELLFSAARDRLAAIPSTATGECALTRIGTVTATGDLVVLDEGGARVDTDAHAHDHFRPATDAR